VLMVDGVRRRSVVVDGCRRPSSSNVDGFFCGQEIIWAQQAQELITLTEWNQVKAADETQNSFSLPN